MSSDDFFNSFGDDDKVPAHAQPSAQVVPPPPPPPRPASSQAAAASALSSSSSSSLIRNPRRPPPPPPAPAPAHAQPPHPSSQQAQQQQQQQQQQQRPLTRSLRRPNQASSSSSMPTPPAAATTSTSTTTTPSYYGASTAPPPRISRSHPSNSNSTSSSSSSRCSSSSTAPLYYGAASSLAPTASAKAATTATATESATTTATKTSSNTTNTNRPPPAPSSGDWYAAEAATTSVAWENGTMDAAASAATTTTTSSSSFLLPSQSQPSLSAPSIFVPSFASRTGGHTRHNASGNSQTTDLHSSTAGTTTTYVNDIHDDYTNEPPLLEELGINLDHIWLKTKAVVLPFKLRKHHADILEPALIVQDADLAGPLALALALGGELLLSGKIQFGYIYGFGVFGCLSMTLILNLMSPTQAVSVWTVTSILGYALLPVNVLAALKLVLVNLARLSTLGRILGLLAVVWSTVASTRLLEIGCGMRDQRYLMAYPIALLYSAFVLITIF